MVKKPISFFYLLGLCPLHFYINDFFIVEFDIGLTKIIHENIYKEANNSAYFTKKSLEAENILVTPWIPTNKDNNIIKNNINLITYIYSNNICTRYLFIWDDI